jgi:hypothetical protein
MLFSGVSRKKAQNKIKNYDKSSVRGIVVIWYFYGFIPAAGSRT